MRYSLVLLQKSVWPNWAFWSKKSKCCIMQWGQQKVKDFILFDFLSQHKRKWLDWKWIVNFVFWKAKVFPTLWWSNDIGQCICRLSITSPRFLIPQPTRAADKKIFNFYHPMASALKDAIIHLVHDIFFKKSLIIAQNVKATTFLKQF